MSFSTTGACDQAIGYTSFMGDHVTLSVDAPAEYVMCINDVHTDHRFVVTLGPPPPSPPPTLPPSPPTMPPPSPPTALIDEFFYYALLSFPFLLGAILGSLLVWRVVALTVRRREANSDERRLEETKRKARERWVAVIASIRAARKMQTDVVSKWSQSVKDAKARAVSSMAWHRLVASVQILGLVADSNIARCRVELAERLMSQVLPLSLPPHVLSSARTALPAIAIEVLYSY